MPRRMLTLIVTCLCITSLVRAQGAPATSAPAGPATGSMIEFRVSPIIDLHMLLRSMSENTAPAEGMTQAMTEALAAIAALETSLGGPRAWLGFEGNFLDCQTAADVTKVFEQLPDRLGAGPRELRQPALKYAAALASAESEFLARQWPERVQRLTQERERLQREFVPHVRAGFDSIIASLGMSDPNVTVPAYLTMDGPGPGRASTSATMENRGVMFIALSAAKGTQFLEIILHEATHALDVATRDQQHALNVMRGKLVDAGVPRTDARWRDTWHTIMFITAADAVRHAIDPKHEDYGVVDKYYDKVPEVAAIERPIWAAYLKGEISRDQAIDDIVKAVAAIAPKS